MCLKDRFKASVGRKSKVKRKGCEDGFMEKCESGLDTFG